jgi:hypothetical protein
MDAIFRVVTKKDVIDWREFLESESGKKEEGC